jgi:hypothetical protein
LLRDSSKGAETAAVAGHDQVMSSSPSRVVDVACGDVAGAGVAAAVVVAVIAGGADAGAEAAARASSGRGSTRVEATGRLVAAAGSTPGATTRSVWPTSITFGFSRLFQRTRSFQFWPVSRPIRIRVSPGLTV